MPAEDDHLTEVQISAKFKNWVTPRRNVGVHIIRSDEIANENSKVTASGLEIRIIH